MAKALVITANSLGTAIYADGAEFAVASNLPSAALASDAVAKSPVAVAGTASHLSVNIDAVGGSRSVSIRVNEGAGNQSVSATDSTAGIFTDVTNTDSLSAGDDINYTLAETGSNPGLLAVWHTYETASGCAVLGGSGTIAASVGQSGLTAYASLLGSISGVLLTTETEQSQALVKAPGTIRRLWANVASNNTDAAHVLTVRVAGSNGNGTISLTANTTGVFEDASNTDAVVADNLVNLHIAFGTISGADICTFRWGATFEGSTFAFDQFGARSSATRAATATVHYFPLAGSTGTSTIGASHTSEDNAEIDPNFSGTFSKFRFSVSANTYSADATVRLRKDGGNANQTVTLTASTTGWFEDASNTDAFADGETWNGSIAGGTSGSITVGMWGITAAEPAPAGQPTVARSGGVNFMHSLRPVGSPQIKIW